MNSRMRMTLHKFLDQVLDMHKYDYERKKRHVKSADNAAVVFFFLMSMLFAFFCIIHSITTWEFIKHMV